MSRDRVAALAFVLVLLAPIVALAQGGAGGGVKDFRAYVFIAYSAAFVLLFAFLAWLFARQKGISEEVAVLKERVDKTTGGADA